MTRLRFLASLLILATIILPVMAGCGPAPTPTPTPLPQPITLTILHTNDTSGYLDPCG